MADSATIAEGVRAKAQAEAARVLADGEWTRDRNVAFDALFERCAVEALRAPALVERSVHLRALFRRFVPTALRPTLKVAVRIADRNVRRIHHLIAERKR